MPVLGNQTSHNFRKEFSSATVGNLLLLSLQSIEVSYRSGGARLFM